MNTDWNEVVRRIEKLTGKRIVVSTLKRIRVRRVPK